MTSKDVIESIQKYYPKVSLVSQFTKGNLILLDSNYAPVTEKDIQRKWYEVWIKSSWDKESWDCDEMALAEMMRVRESRSVDGSAKAIGCIGGVFKTIVEGPHAVNFFIQQDMTLRLWDYQRQQVFFPRVDDVVMWAII